MRGKQKSADRVEAFEDEGCSEDVDGGSGDCLWVAVHEIMLEIMQLVDLHQVLVGNGELFGGVQLKLSSQFEVVEVSLVVGLHPREPRNATLLVSDLHNAFHLFENLAVHLDGCPLGQHRFGAGIVVASPLLAEALRLLALEEDEVAVGHVVQLGTDKDRMFDITVEADHPIPLFFFHPDSVIQLAEELEVLSAFFQTLLQFARL